MKNFLDKIKIPAAIIIAAVIIAASIWLSNKPPSAVPQAAPQTEQSQRQSTAPLQQTDININYTQAPDFVGKYVCVTGVVDNIFTSKTNTVFFNFCKDYKNCPFSAVIFKLNAPKFPDPSLFLSKTVRITGFITSYQGRPEIVLEDPAQIKIVQ